MKTEKRPSGLATTASTVFIFGVIVMIVALILAMTGAKYIPVAIVLCIGFVAVIVGMLISLVIVNKYSRVKNDQSPKEVFSEVIQTLFFLLP